MKKKILLIYTYTINTHVCDYTGEYKTIAYFYNSYSDLKGTI